MIFCRRCETYFLSSKLDFLTFKPHLIDIFVTNVRKIAKIFSDSVSCDANYLIPTCSDLCIDTNDATGHYKCNYAEGTRECLQGWYGERCNKKVTLCTPRNDTLGHYKCNSATGEKICLPGWKNATTNCTEGV